MFSEMDRGTFTSPGSRAGSIFSSVASFKNNEEIPEEHKGDEEYTEVNDQIVNFLKNQKDDQAHSDQVNQQMIRLLYNKRVKLFIKLIEKENENINFDQYFRIRFDTKMMLNPVMFLILTFITDNLKSENMLRAVLKYNPNVNQGLV